MELINHTINFHLSGDIVLCPDHKALKARDREIKDSHRICIYNEHELTCRDWLAAVRSHKYSGRCCLSGSPDCKHYVERCKQGNIKKTFGIQYKDYRKCASAAHYLMKAAKDLHQKKCDKAGFKLKKHYKKDGTETKALHRLIEKSNKKIITHFITLTFPPFRKKHKLTKSLLYNEIVNTYFSRFMENLRSNYYCTGYVAVREFGEVGGRVHFHCVIGMPYTDYQYLNSVWCNTIQDLCEPAPNALTTPKDYSQIRSINRAVRYVCKYFSKCKGQRSTARLIFISNNVLQRAKQLDCRIEQILNGYKEVEIYKTSDYSTLFRVHNPYSFALFCKNLLYPLFFPDNYP